MKPTLVFVLLAVFAARASALDCIQIPDSYIHDGDQFYFPVNSTQYVTLPANFDCTYTIKAPNNPTPLLGTIKLTNELKGPNDQIIVTDSLGTMTTLTSRGTSAESFEVVPGRNVTIRVITKSVLMNSQFLIYVKYDKVYMGPTNVMKTGGVMNFVDLSTLMGFNPQYPSTVTYTIGDPVQLHSKISVAAAVGGRNYPYTYLYHIYIIDGTLTNQVSIHRVSDFVYESAFISTTNTVTIASFQKYPDYNTAVVLNPLSEVKDFGELAASVSPEGHLNKIELGSSFTLNAREVVSLTMKKQITIDSLMFFGDKIYPNCTAQIVSGPPNKSSQVLLDLTEARGLMPYTLNLPYFSVIAEYCSFTFTVQSPGRN